MCADNNKMLVQYRESSERLIALATSSDAERPAARKVFNTAARKTNTVGIYYET